ncbi:response regulator [Chitinophaga sp. sic0106]|uniref:response regulator n=1 Tax=Chitinophaga sp. sic0106 TaxID=2854785 RepID=UPI001C481127|nr:response regulator [Chitinophaga sp. sic0106]MBV7531977.1 response regulator [Chitinophaga sp. sic0106]
MTPSILPGRFQHISKKRLLLVDADECFGASLKDALAQVHYEVDWEKDHQAAVERARTISYSLVLIDDHVTGIPLPALIRDILQPHKPPVIIFGTAVIASEQEDCVAAGATGFISKCTNDLASLLIKIIAITATVHAPN